MTRFSQIGVVFNSIDWLGKFWAFSILMSAWYGTRVYARGILMVFLIRPRFLDESFLLAFLLAYILGTAMHTREYDLRGEFAYCSSPARNWITLANYIINFTSVAKMSSGIWHRSKRHVHMCFISLWSRGGNNEQTRITCKSLFQLLAYSSYKLLMPDNFAVNDREGAFRNACRGRLF